MKGKKLQRLFKEKSTLLNQWSRARGDIRLKILVRILDIEDELSQIEK